MSPDSSEPTTRIRTLEQQMAGVLQQLNDLSRDAAAIHVLERDVSEVKVAVQYMQRDNQDLKMAMREIETNLAAQIDKLSTSINEREKGRVQSENARRSQYVLATFALAGVFIGVLAQIIITLTS